MIVILGGGVSGLTAAALLSKNHEVILVEKQDSTGGLAKSININGFDFDIGSHRIHPAYNPIAMDYIKELLGDDLEKHPRNGRILINKKFIKYPPNYFTLISNFGVKKFIIWSFDFIKAKLFYFKYKKIKFNSFQDYIVSSLGKGLYEDFYEPYARKLWNLDPKELSYEPATHRVRRINILSSIKKLFKKSDSNYFLYPKNGIGQIANEIKKEFLKNGGKLYQGYSVTNFSQKDSKITDITIQNDSEKITLNSDKVISTIPLKSIYKLLNTNNKEISLNWRSLKIISIVTKDHIPNPYETHYIPDESYLSGRISEITKYKGFFPKENELNAITIEIPCTFKDNIWNLDENEIVKKAVKELVDIEVLKDNPEIQSSKVININHVYPIYKTNWKKDFNLIIDEINSVKNLYNLGRSALFLHCNIDHCIYMGHKLSDYLENPENKNWREIQDSFQEFYVRE
ncbi:UNVERIFIED_CONTAM: hypothetical protein GTU68_065689 [Idotea baltica]|nr:hypothetical protein [Idotea baltica]